MKRHYLFGTVLAAALSVGVAQAQSAPPTSGQTQGTQTQGTQTQGTQSRPGQATPTNPASPQTPTQGTGTATSPRTPTTGTPTGSQIQQPVPGTQGAATPGTNPGQPAQPVTLTGCLTPAVAGSGQPGYTLLNATGGTVTTPTSYALLGGDSTSLLKYGNSRVEVIGSMDPQPAAAFSGGSQIGRSPMGQGNTGAVGTSGSGATPMTGSVRTTPPPSPTASTGTMTTTPAPNTGTATSAATSNPNFHVTSIRQVPGSCGGQ